MCLMIGDSVLIRVVRWLPQLISLGLRPVKYGDRINSEIGKESDDLEPGIADVGGSATSTPSNCRDPRDATDRYCEVVVSCRWLQLVAVLN